MICALCFTLYHLIVTQTPWVLVSSPFFRWENGDSDRINNLPVFGRPVMELEFKPNYSSKLALHSEPAFCVLLLFPPPSIISCSYSLHLLSLFFFYINSFFVFHSQLQVLLLKTPVYLLGSTFTFLSLSHTSSKFNSSDSQSKYNLCWPTVHTISFI